MENKAIRPYGFINNDMQRDMKHVRASSATPSWFWSIDDKPS